MRRNLLALVGLAALSVSGAALRADTVLSLGLPNSGISGYTAPYASVNIHWTDSTHANVTFTGLSNSSNIYLLGDGGTAGVNVNASSFSLSNLTGSNDPSDLSNGGAGNEDGFGSFNLTINNFDGFEHAHHSVSFTLTNTSGTWGSSDDVLTGNSQGYRAAAHIFVANSDGTNTNDTGFAANGSNAVPLPAAAWMGMSLMGSVGGAGWIRRRRQQA